MLSPCVERSRWGWLSCSRINAPASASDVGRFSSAQPSEITIDRAGGGIISVTGVRSADPKLTLSGIDTRSTSFGPDIPAPACPGGNPAHCATIQFQAITVFVQGGIRNGLTLFTRASSPGPPRACPLPSTPAFPQLVQPGLFGAHVTYTAPLPASLLDPGRRVIIIHGTGSATSHRRDVVDAHATTRLRFTLKLVRIR